MSKKIDRSKGFHITAMYLFISISFLCVDVYSYGECDSTTQSCKKDENAVWTKSAPPSQTVIPGAKKSGLEQLGPSENKGKGGWFGTSFCKPQTIDTLKQKFDDWKGETTDKDVNKCSVSIDISDLETQFKGIEIDISSLLSNGVENAKDSGNYRGKLESKLREVNAAKANLIEVSNSAKEIEFEATGDLGQCVERGIETDQLCCEGTNPKSMEIRNMLGVAIPALSGMSAKLACSKFNSVMMTVGGLMTAWNGVCSAKKIQCESKCDDSREKFLTYNKSLQNLNKYFSEYNKHLSALVTAVSDQPVNVNFQDYYRTLASITSGKINAYISSLTKKNSTLVSCASKAEAMLGPLERQAKQCQAWGKDIATSLVGIGGLIMQAKQKSKCGPAEEPNTCNPAAPTAATCAAFCADAANKSNPACRCILNPLASGCMDGSGRGYANGGGGNFNAMNFNKPGAMAPGNDTTTNPAPEFGGPSSGNGGGGPSGRGGGGGGGLGGGSVLGSSSKPSGAGAAGKSGSRIDPNVISGFEGGGGASGSKAGGGYGANSAVMDKLKSELKTKTDKLRGLASEDDPHSQITGAGGKTNWEKASDRYRDMTGQMIKDD